MSAFVITCFIICYTLTYVTAETIEVMTCPPPDFPDAGDYGPKHKFYIPGDRIHYFCDTDRFIGGNYLRVCKDTGDWTGDTPVCDAAVKFASVNQSSTLDSDIDSNGAENARDGLRDTCSSTNGERDAVWMATLRKPSHVLRVMLFLPMGDTAYDVISVKQDGTEHSCGSAERRIERLEWHYHNCLEPHNTKIVAIKIKSLSSIPLQLCEVIVHALTDPTCIDPHVSVENGRIMLSRKSAHLVCDKGHTPSSRKKLTCIRTGEWTKWNLYCTETDRDVSKVKETVEDPEEEEEMERETERAINPRDSSGPRAGDRNGPNVRRPSVRERKRKRQRD